MPVKQAASMKSSRPYLIRAIHEWIVDSGLTPYLIVDAEAPGVEVPRQHVQQGRIVLDVSPRAVRGLQLGNDWIEFGARFGGTSLAVRLPTNSIQAVYAKENGVGMAFQESSTGEEPPPDPSGGNKAKPKLRVVK
jgi:stringent starvation protein B